MIGRIGRIFPDKGYGFIVTEEEEEFFFHASALKDIKFKQLCAMCVKEKPLVYFKDQKHPRGPRAYHVELVPDDVPNA